MSKPLRADDPRAAVSASIASPWAMASRRSAATSSAQSGRERTARQSSTKRSMLKAMAQAPAVEPVTWVDQAKRKRPLSPAALREIAKLASGGRLLGELGLHLALDLQRL